MVKSRDDVPDVRQLSIEPHETPSGIEITDASTISSDKSVDDDKVSTMSSDKHDDNASRRSSISETDTGVPRRVKSGSLKSMLFGDRGKMKDEEAKRSTSWMQSKQEEKVDSKPEVQYPKNQKSDSRVDERFIAPSRVDDDSSFVKAFIQTRKPPPAGNQVANERRKDLPPRPPPLKPTSKSSSWNSDEKAASEGRDETDVGDRDDWDAPIEQNRRYGHQEVQESTPSISGRDEDSWSIASMLSLKKWRNNKKQLDPEKIDNIMFTRTKNKCDGVTSPSLGQPSFDSISHGASNRDKLTRKGGNRGVFPKGPSFDSISHEASNRDMPTGKGGNRGVFPKPYIEYHENEKTWVIGNQWKQNGNGEKDKMLHVYDNKQRVHVTNCHGVNIHIHGRKMKAILVENSSDVNVIFDTVITTCEVVSCSNVGVQVTGLCPTFSIDTTKGVTVWLTREAMRSSNFVTSKSSDISISVPQSDDMHPWERKEVPLPIQYVHKFEEGGIMSHLPGKY